MRRRVHALQLSDQYGVLIGSIYNDNFNPTLAFPLTPPASHRPQRIKHGRDWRWLVRLDPSSLALPAFSRLPWGKRGRHWLWRLLWLHVSARRLRMVSFALMARLTV